VAQWPDGPDTPCIGEDEISFQIETRWLAEAAAAHAPVIAPQVSFR